MKFSTANESKTNNDRSVKTPNAVGKEAVGSPTNSCRLRRHCAGVRRISPRANARRTQYANMGRAVRGVHDLVGVSWLLRRLISDREPGSKFELQASARGRAIDAEESAHHAMSGVRSTANNPPQMALNPTNE